jgi:shikimate 5-dehydrogenase
MNHSSLVGLRTEIVIASLGHDFTHSAHRLHAALESIVRGKVNSGQGLVVSVPLKQAALASQVAQMSVLARRATTPVRA